MILLAIAAGATGAVCRYLISGVVQKVSRSDFPLGTLAVNLTGSFLIGAFSPTGMTDSVATTAGLAFLGGFTTFSSWILESLRLGPHSTAAVMNLCVTLAGGVSAAALGYSLTH